MPRQQAPKDDAGLGHLKRVKSAACSKHLTASGRREPALSHIHYQQGAPLQIARKLSEPNEEPVASPMGGDRLALAGKGKEAPVDRMGLALRPKTASTQKVAVLNS